MNIKQKNQEGRGEGLPWKFAVESRNLDLATQTT